MDKGLEQRHKGVERSRFLHLHKNIFFGGPIGRLKPPLTPGLSPTELEALESLLQVKLIWEGAVLLCSSVDLKERDNLPYALQLLPSTAVWSRGDSSLENTGKTPNQQRGGGSQEVASSCALRVTRPRGYRVSLWPAEG